MAATPKNAATPASAFLAVSTSGDVHVGKVELVCVDAADRAVEEEAEFEVLGDVSVSYGEPDVQVILAGQSTTALGTSTAKVPLWSSQQSLAALSSPQHSLL
jgi:hypothetical protein